MFSGDPILEINSRSKN